jgi:hypothetical protein
MNAVRRGLFSEKRKRKKEKGKRERSKKQPDT